MGLRNEVLEWALYMAKEMWWLEINICRSFVADTKVGTVMPYKVYAYYYIF